MKRFGVLAALAAVAFSLVPAATAQASSYSERQRELQQLIAQKRAQLRNAEAKEHDILTEIQASDARRDALIHKIGQLNARLTDARAQIDLLETRLDLLDLQMQQKRAQVEQAQAQLDEVEQRLNARIAAIYMGMGSDISRGIDKLNNINDYVAATSYEAGIIVSDQSLLKAVERAKANLVAQQGQIAATQDQVQTNRDQIAGQAQRILDTRTELAGARAQVNAEIAHKQVLLADVQAQKRSYIRAIQSYVQESNSIEAFLKGIQAGQRVIQGRGGWLKWPVSGPITSPFGWRIHPVYHYRSFHTGIDIGAPMGKTVKAARYGNVVYTGYKGAYGNVVIIDHGYGIATMYAHLSKFYVHVGQWVKTMQPIAAVGTTGWSTGPHLHFEVRQGGSPVNPVRWL